MEQHAVWAPLTAFLAAFAAVWWLARSPAGKLALDYPNARSLHQAPLPRTGGIGIHAAIVLSAALIAAGAPYQTWVSFTILLLVSLIDDIRGVPVALRLAAHLAAAGAFAASLLLDSHGIAGAVLAAIAIAWMINLYNFMDGSDGLAGGMTVFGFSFYAFAAWPHGSIGFALLTASIAAAAAAFLAFNFYPARIFMGDAGSVPLGFLAGALGLFGWREDIWPVWFPFLVFSPFIVDATVTLGRRLARREPVWQAHRDHYYQRLVQLGWGHRGTAFAEYALMLASGSLALAMLSMNPAVQIVSLLGVVTAYAVLIVLMERTWRMKHEAHSDRA